MLVAVCHSEETGWVQIDDLATLSDLRRESNNLVWAEAVVSDLTEDDAQTLKEEFDLHDLAVEDAIKPRQRPKLEPYEHHLFLVVHQLDEENDQLEARQIACFIGPRFMITLHEGAERVLEPAKDLWRKESGALRGGPAHLVHGVLDVLVDDFENIATRLEDEVEELEEIVLEVPTAPVQRQLYSIKQKVSRLRRYALPVQRLVESISNDPSLLGSHSQVQTEHFRDVSDHLQRLADQVRNIDDLTDAVLDLRRAEQAQFLNDVTKRLTGWAAIVAVPTFIASVYGMNFALVPAAGHIFGFWFALALMTVTGIGLYISFKRRDWI